MIDSRFSSVEDVSRQHGPGPIDTALVDFRAGGVRLLSGGRQFLVAFDEVPTLYRRGILAVFVADYLRTQLVL